ncbi:UNVERIFIED_CONTAM: hypothetical protein GTU68_005377 [Idotea baltica]|nr:hypothetical protein [Idotea baltica]
MRKILITGGAGFIASSLADKLLEDTKNKLVIVDNLSTGKLNNYSNSRPDALKRTAQIAGQEIKNYDIDLCDMNALRAIAQKEKIDGIIHFAAYKAVGESYEQPLKYYRNNLYSLINILDLLAEFKIPNFIFSSSCSIYGDIKESPVTEESPMQPAESAYGNTKQMGEQMIEQYSKVHDTKSIALRYFNPVGSHPTGLIGDHPIVPSSNLVPIIAEVAIGKREKLSVFGSDYDTRDGSCIRDYIHVCDIASAHTSALKMLENNGEYPNFDVINLGSGNGVTVIEMIKAFEEATGLTVNHELVARRPGDVEAVYANNNKAKNILNWVPKFELKEMMSSTLKWQQFIAKSENQ